MLNVNETMTAYDLAEALADEYGKFEVTLPTGEKFVVTSKPGHTLSNIRPLGENGRPQPWRIRKVADVPSAVERLAA